MMSTSGTQLPLKNSMEQKFYMKEHKITDSGTKYGRPMTIEQKKIEGTNFRHEGTKFATAEQTTSTGGTQI
jgi:hypothetical protein